LLEVKFWKSFALSRDERESAAAPVGLNLRCRVHKTLGQTLAMAADFTDHVWTVEELLTMPV
jgi:hypothetical protein